MEKATKQLVMADMSLSNSSLFASLTAKLIFKIGWNEFNMK
jgi:hypothetical protein